MNLIVNKIVCSSSTKWYSGICLHMQITFLRYSQTYMETYRKIARRLPRLMGRKVASLLHWIYVIR
jgi:hypothetical protein